jgi:hypothetical protein
MESEFALSRIAEIARAPKRAVQLWADAGVIKADPSTMTAGSGVHRVFGRDEAIIACIVALFAKQKMAIGGLKAVSDAMRVYLRKDYPTAGVFKRAIAGEGSNYLLAYWAERKDGGLYISDYDIPTDARSRGINFFDQMRKPDKHPVKIDVIALNEALRDVPAGS